MSSSLSLSSVTLISINIMLGTGLFINTLPLVQQVGFLGFVSYMLVALLIAPLIVSFGNLLELYPQGSFYAYSAHRLGSLWGFISSWSYFISKLASAALLIIVFSQFLSGIFPGLPDAYILLLQILVVLIFMSLNFFALKTGRIIIYFFLLLKILPILFIIGACLKLFYSWHLPTGPLAWNAVGTTIPLVLYAFTGFEACCSLSSLLKNPSKQGPKALLISFSSVVCLTIIYQFLFYIAFGPQLLGTQTGLIHFFPALLKVIYPASMNLQAIVALMLYGALGCACLGGAYGILLSNHWNFYSLAQHNHLIGSSSWRKLNSSGIPYRGLIASAVIVIFYIVLCRSNILILQQISVFGCTIAFALSMLSLSLLSQGWRKLVALIGLINCMLVLLLCMKNFYSNGFMPLIIFSGLLSFGLIHYLYQKYILNY